MNISLKSWFCSVIYQTEIKDAIKETIGLREADRLAATTAVFNRIITDRKCLTKDWFADTTKEEALENAYKEFIDKITIDLTKDLTNIKTFTGKTLPPKNQATKEERLAEAKAKAKREELEEEKRKELEKQKPEELVRLEKLKNEALSAKGFYAAQQLKYPTIYTSINRSVPEQEVISAPVQPNVQEATHQVPTTEPEPVQPNAQEVAERPLIPHGKMAGIIQKQIAEYIATQPLETLRETLRDPKLTVLSNVLFNELKDRVEWPDYYSNGQKQRAFHEQLKLIIELKKDEARKEFSGLVCNNETAKERFKSVVGTRPLTDERIETLFKGDPGIIKDNKLTMILVVTFKDMKKAQIQKNLKLIDEELAEQKRKEAIEASKRTCYATLERAKLEQVKPLEQPPSLDTKKYKQLERAVNTFDEFGWG